MAKITIYFNNNEYEIDSTLLSESSAAFVEHLTTDMAGEGASVTFNGTSYSIDATKLNAAKANFIAHLGTISGTDKTITIDGESYGIDATAIEDSVAGLETLLTELEAESGGDEPVAGNYLTFSSPSSFTLNIVDNTKYWDGTLEYSTDTNTWNEWDGTTTLSADSGKLYMRGTGNTYITGSSASSSKACWVLTGSDISCSGNIETLLDYATVANGEHPTMASYCYHYMFRDCASLVTAPELPATTLADHCYRYMFDGCTSLTAAPKLPATTLASYCYCFMFRDCASLTTVPELPATTLAERCYKQMFYRCTSLKLSTTQNDEYITAYRIPTSGEGTMTTEASDLSYMFTYTGGTFTGTPEINTTYYLHSSNSVI